MYTSQGDPIHGEVSSADAHLGVAATLYDSGVVASTRTLTSKERVYITDILIGVTSAGAVEVAFASSDGAGVRVVKAFSPATNVLEHHFETPMAGPLGVVPTLIAAAACGQVDLVFTGYIVEA